LYQDETETNISDLIDRLGEEEEEEEDYIYMDPGLQLDLAPGRVVSTQFVDQDPEITAFAAVQDILGKLLLFKYGRDGRGEILQRKIFIEIGLLNPIPAGGGVKLTPPL